MKRIILVMLAATLIAGCARAGEERIKVQITGGHDTDPRDHGRPVILVGNALGVTPEIFRDAFSGVHPAGPGSGGPTGEEARANKAVLMKALGKYGITNERLDEVSNFYRYPPGRGNLWKTSAATAYATVKDGVVTGVSISEAGAGYSSIPTVLIPGHPEVTLKATVAYGKDLKKNGCLSEIVVNRPAAAAK